MRVQDFHFDLPQDLVAQEPPAVRGTSRMLVLDRRSGAYRDDNFRNLPGYLRSGDLLIVNDSRVIPARLYAVRAGRKTQPGPGEPKGRIEVLLTQQLREDEWSALVRPARKVEVGERLLFSDSEHTEPLLQADVIAAGDFGERTLRFYPTPNLLEVLERIGRMPLPPYIRRSKSGGDTLEDRDRYQTVYANTPGSAAAPTAGLHFTPEMFAALKANGVEIETVMLHVGLGTFQPVRVKQLEDVRLHAEPWLIPDTTSDAIIRAHRSGRRIIAVGTTSVRTLEAAVAAVSESGGIDPFARELWSNRHGRTEIFISAGVPVSAGGRSAHEFPSAVLHPSYAR